MSRSFVVTKRRRAPYRENVTQEGEMLDPRSIPVNTFRGMEDVGYSGPPNIELPEGKDITISNRSGDRKKIS
jgi:hypothetical protein